MHELTEVVPASSKPVGDLAQDPVWKHEVLAFPSATWSARCEPATSVPSPWPRPAPHPYTPQWNECIPQTMSEPK